MKNKLFILIIFLFGTGLRLYSALKQPLWLDEIYSLYFADNFSALKLIFQPPEAHPGAYYLLLKGLLSLSTDLLFLRTISSVIPVLIGCIILYRQTHSKFFIVILLLNPFFIHMSWQLRMYGLTFMFSAILISLFLNTSLVNRKKLLILSLISTLFSFSLIIPIFCLYLYLYFREKKIINFLPFFLIPLEFFITKGFFTYKKYAEYAAWINSPTLTNIPNTILTAMGFNTDINNLQHSTFIAVILFFIISIPLTIYISKKYRLFFYTFTLPLLTTILISAFFPPLSQRFFFYHFIPKISLFIPRFLLPLSLSFYLFFSYSIKNRYQIPLLLIFLVFWFIPNLKLNLHPYYSDVSPLSYPSDTLIMPPWENLRLNSSFSHQDLNKISHDFDIATNIENNLIKTPQNPDCNSLNKFKKVIYLIDPSIKNISNYHLKMQQLINQCSTTPL